ncbi:MAG: NAD-dependent epimerase/dehydratase family protein, partial [Thermoplasmata archaeon]
MAKYLVTGGAGFIGSNLVRSLIREGHEIIVVDSLHTGNEKLISDLDVKSYFMRVDEFFKKGEWKEIDGIFHLGKPSASPIYKENREKLVESLNGTVSVLEMAKELNVKLVTASSSSLYNG